MSGSVEIWPVIDLSWSVDGDGDDCDIGDDDGDDYVDDDDDDDEPEVELVVGVSDADGLLQVSALKPDYKCNSQTWSTNVAGPF